MSHKNAAQRSLRRKECESGRHGSLADKNVFFLFKSFNCYRIVVKGPTLLGSEKSFLAPV